MALADVGVGTVIGVSGLGGLGHLAIKLAKARGAARPRTPDVSVRIDLDVLSHAITPFAAPGHIMELATAIAAMKATSTASETAAK